jgi:Pyruvate/2-oxoacid:ferredoxin oxidoreductase delta subunit
MTDGKPKWLGHCEQCFACFHWCPQKAVQYGRSSKQRRYHHPQAALSDFFQCLEK